MSTYVRYPKVGLPQTPLSVANGGTGLSSLGSANQVLGVNNAGTAMEYKTISGTGSQITVTQLVGAIALSLPDSVSIVTSLSLPLILNGAGSAAAPSYSFTGVTNMGLASISASVVALCANGQPLLQLSASSNRARLEFFSTSAGGQNAFITANDPSGVGLQFNAPHVGSQFSFSTEGVNRINIDDGGFGLVGTNGFYFNTDGGADIGRVTGSGTNHRPNNVYVKTDVIADGKGRFTGGLGVGNSAAATTPGTVTKKMEVFDATGASIGFVAVYDAIT